MERDQIKALVNVTTSPPQLVDALARIKSIHQYKYWSNYQISWQCNYKWVDEFCLYAPARPPGEVVRWLHLPVYPSEIFYIPKDIVILFGPRHTTNSSTLRKFWMQRIFMKKFIGTSKLLFTYFRNIWEDIIHWKYVQILI